MQNFLRNNLSRKLTVTHLGIPCAISKLTQFAKSSTHQEITFLLWDGTWRCHNKGLPWKYPWAKWQIDKIHRHNLLASKFILWSVNISSCAKGVSGLHCRSAAAIDFLDRQYLGGYRNIFEKKEKTNILNEPEPEWPSGLQRRACCTTHSHGFDPRTSTNACGHVCRYVDQKAWLPSWPQHSQQVSHQRWIWGIVHRQESMQARYPPWFWNPRQTSPEVQNRGISGPTKRPYVLQNKIKKFM